MTHAELTATADYRALHRGVLTDPADDLRRLVFADFLEENGQDDRAEFVRVQVELARPDLSADDRILLRRRESEAWRMKVTSGYPVHEVSPGSWFKTEGLDLSLGLYQCFLGYDPGDGKSVAWPIVRGFVSAVTLTMAAFSGAPCTWCDLVTCPACAGTGRTPGLAAAIFRTHPITAVTLSDREPHDCGRTVEWYRSPERHRTRAALPPELYDALAGGRRQTDPTPVASYPTADEATRAVSRACVAYGRELAGLTPLPRE